MHFYFATIEDIPFPSRKDRKVTGKIEIEVEYGPAIDDVKFLLQCEAELFVVYSPMQSSVNKALSD
jgi:hypothetical protein